MVSHSVTHPVCSRAFSFLRSCKYRTDLTMYLILPYPYAYSSVKCLKCFLEQNQTCFLTMSFITGLVRVAIIVLTGFTTNLLWSHFRSPIKHFPGPFVAKFTNLWRFIDVYRGRAELTHRELHKKHGVAVQLGPNLISLSDPKLLRTVYNIRGDFVKVGNLTLACQILPLIIIRVSSIV